jgi:hypothetical protein
MNTSKTYFDHEKLIADEDYKTNERRKRRGVGALFFASKRLMGNPLHIRWNEATFGLLSDKDDS